MDSVVYGCSDGSDVDRGRGPEVALYVRAPSRSVAVAYDFAISRMPAWVLFATQ